MSDKTEPRFVVTPFEEGMDMTEYFQDFAERLIEYLRSRNPTWSDESLETISFNSTGSRELEVKPEARISRFVIRPDSGTEAYSYILVLPEDRKYDLKEGDQIELFFSAPRSVNPTISVEDHIANSVLSVTFDGTGDDHKVKTITRVNDTWLASSN